MSNANGTDIRTPQDKKMDDKTPEELLQYADDHEQIIECKRVHDSEWGGQHKFWLGPISRIIAGSVVYYDGDGFDRIIEWSDAKGRLASATECELVSLEAIPDE